jgi:hypothetical protein
LSERKVLYADLYDRFVLRVNYCIRRRNKTSRIDPRSLSIVSAISLRGKESVEITFYAYSHHFPTLLLQNSENIIYPALFLAGANNGVSHIDHQERNYDVHRVKDHFFGIRVKEH